nr:ribonuclease H-like domain-containing protein [Tanacetum cinerariifolium]
MLEKSSMMKSNGFFFFKFASIEGMNGVFENGLWFIRSAPIILKKWTPNVDLLKDDMNSVPIWVKFYDILIVDDWELKEDMIIAIPNGEDDGDILHTIRLEYEWEPPRCGDELGSNRGSSNSFKKVVQDVAGSADNDSEVEEVYDETATYMTSTGFNVNKASNSGTGEGNKSLYKQWKENHAEDPYDDDNFDDPGLSDAQIKFANAFDTNLRVKDFLTRHILFRCDSSSDLYPVTLPSPTPHGLLSVSPNAMYDEYNALIKNGTWILVPKPPNVNVVRSMWLFRHKYHADGSLSMYKARLVTNGRNQQYGVDCNDTFSLVVKQATIRTVLSLALAQNWPVHQLDVKNAFLNGTVCLVSMLYGLCSSCGIYFESMWSSVSHLYSARYSYVVQQICLHMHDPREPHLAALKRVLRYICGTLDHGLQLHVSSTSQLNAYTYADWAGCPVTRRSTFGYCVFFGDNLLSWSAKRQVTLSRSSAEAEYRGVANVVAKIAWIHNLLRELHNPLFTATLVYCDNVSAVYMSTNPIQHQRTKHIEIDIHFVRDMVARGQVRVLHVPSRYQYADIFIKGLPTALFEEFRTSLSVRSSPAQTASEC